MARERIVPAILQLDPDVLVEPRLPNAAAVVLAQVVREYRACHELGDSGNSDLGDFDDGDRTVVVRGIHPYEHRRSAVA